MANGYKMNFALKFICFFNFINLILNFDARRGMSRIYFSQLDRNIEDKNLSNTFNSTEINARKFLNDIGKNKMNPEKIAKDLKNYFDIFKLRRGRNHEVNFYEEHYFPAKLDHFASDDNSTFNMRFLINDEYFDKTSKLSPILFYCGNEGPIEDFWKNSGFVTETLAQNLKALVIFGEHRFFGKSMPFSGSQDFDIKKNKYLSVEQALGDFIEFLENFRKTKKWNDMDHPVIAVGGSYGGMLAAWGRMKFPHVFSGAIASSAPILLFEDINKISNSFFRITTDTYKRYNDKCPKYIRSGFETFSDFEKLKKSQDSSVIFEELNKIFNVCTPIKNFTEIKMLEDTIEDALIALAQYNYPYETSFLNPTPGEPVKVACGRISQYALEKEKESKSYFTQTKSDNLTEMMALMKNSVKKNLDMFNKTEASTMYDNLHYLKQAIDVFFNYTGTQECLDIGNSASTVSSLNGWSFLACSEMVMPMETNGITDMFNPKKWNLKEYSAQCKETWKSDLRPTWAFNFFGGRNFYKEIINYSNIIFTNGVMDPWNAGCPKAQELTKSSSVHIFESDSAHHLDLRLPHSKDPESVIKARQNTIEQVTKWINTK